MDVAQFGHDLPEELIALRPASPRDAARLLVVRENGTREHRGVRELPDLLREGDVLVVNDTKVFPARLHGRRLGREGGDGARIEIMLHKRVSPSGFRALVRPAKRLKPGDRVLLGVTLEGTVVSRDRAEVEIRFDKQGVALDYAIAAEGETPLPPFLPSAGKAAQAGRAGCRRIIKRSMPRNVRARSPRPSGGAAFYRRSPRIRLSTSSVSDANACHTACGRRNVRCPYPCNRHQCPSHACGMGGAWRP